MLGKLFGENGQIEIYAAAVDPRHVAMAYMSEENLKEVMQTAKSAEQGLGANEGIQTAARSLSQQAQWVGYVSPQGVQQYMQRMIETLVPQQQRQQIPQIPAFPSSPPLGLSLRFDGQALEAELVAPAESLAALGNYIQAVRH